MSENLFQLPSKKRTAFLQKLSDAGMTSDKLVGALAADHTALERWVQQCPRGQSVTPLVADVKSGIVYDAAAMSRILGLPCECSDPVPEAADGEIVVYYGGWDLKQLRLSKAGMIRMWQDQNWYDDKGWKAEPGYYRLNLRVPNSNRKNWNEKIAHLRTIDETAQAAPVTVAGTALLVHLTETGNDLLKNEWCRCAEPLPGAYRAELTVYKGRVGVDDGWGDVRSDNLWLASARLVASRKF